MADGKPKPPAIPDHAQINQPGHNQTELRLLHFHGFSEPKLRGAGGPASSLGNDEPLVTAFAGTSLCRELDSISLWPGHIGVKQFADDRATCICRGSPIRPS
jgi:hypothetical protein